LLLHVWELTANFMDVSQDPVRHGVRRECNPTLALPFSVKQTNPEWWTYNINISTLGPAI